MVRTHNEIEVERQNRLEKNKKEHWRLGLCTKRAAMQRFFMKHH